MIPDKDNIKFFLEQDDFIVLSYIYSYASKKFWRLLKDITITLSDGTIITIPKGFTTDLSSSPKWLWSIERPFGDFLLAAIIHDYLYHVKMWTRKDSDHEMLFWSRIVNDTTWYYKLDNYIRYLAVRIFGWIVWKF